MNLYVTSSGLARGDRGEGGLFLPPRVAKWAEKIFLMKKIIFWAKQVLNYRPK
jgi:hypothetical protein